MKNKKSILVFSQGYIKSYWNYTGKEDIDIFSTDKEYIKNIIPLFDTFMIHATNRMITKKQAMEYMTITEKERKSKY